MPTVMKVRRQSGARGAIVVEPEAPARRRFSLGELLQGAEHLPDLCAGAGGALDGRRSATRSADGAAPGRPEGGQVYTIDFVP